MSNAAVFSAQPVGTIMFASFSRTHATYIKLPDGRWQDYCQDSRPVTWTSELFSEHWVIERDHVVFT